MWEARRPTFTLKAWEQARARFFELNPVFEESTLGPKRFVKFKRNPEAPPARTPLERRAEAYEQCMQARAPIGAGCELAGALLECAGLSTRPKDLDLLFELLGMSPSAVPEPGGSLRVDDDLLSLALFFLVSARRLDDLVGQAIERPKQRIEIMRDIVLCTFALGKASAHIAVLVYRRTALTRSLKLTEKAPEGGRKSGKVRQGKADKRREDLLAALAEEESKKGSRFPSKVEAMRAVVRSSGRLSSDEIRRKVEANLRFLDRSKSGETEA